MSQKLQGSGFNYCIKALTVAMLCLAVTLAMAPSSRADVVARYAFTSDATESINGSYTGFNGTLENGATCSGGSVVLNGTNQYVDVGYAIANAMMGLTGSCTIETWVTWNGTGSLNQHIFDFGAGLGLDISDPVNYPSGQWVPNNHVYLAANEGTAAPGNIAYAQTPVVTKSNGEVAGGTLGTSSAYIAVTYTAASSGRFNKALYVNGVLVAANYPTAGPSPTFGSVVGTYSFIGKDQGGDPAAASPPDVPAPIYFGGSVSDFRIWNNALSATDIAAHNSNPNAGNGLAVWYRHRHR